MGRSMGSRKSEARWRNALNLFETIDTEPRLYIRNPATVVWLFIGRKKWPVSIYRFMPTSSSWALLAVRCVSRRRRAFSRLVDRALSLNFNINGKCYPVGGEMQVEKFTSVMHDTLSESCCEGASLLIFAWSSSFECFSAIWMRFAQ